jgi:uncharacterized RDD family membrane protein YckC
MYCAKCGAQNEDRAMYCQSCGTVFHAKAAPAGAYTAAASVPEPPAASVGEYAGFWERFFAAVIDWFVLVCGSVIIWIASFGTVPIAFIPMGWLYEALMTSSEWQATLGKRAMNIIVIGVDGGRISFLRATGRHFAKYISGFILFIGYIMAAFTERKQALHDMMAETFVVKGKLGKLP